MRSYRIILLLLLLGQTLAQKPLRDDNDEDTDNEDKDSAEDDTDYDHVICDGQVHFELMTGYVYTSAEDIMLSKEHVKFLKDCIDMCKEDTRCKAINFETGLCITFKSSAGENSDKLQLSQLPVFTLYAQKICMPQDSKTCSGAWAYETSPNIGVMSKFSEAEREASSRLDCALQCLEEKEFECRSASYNFDKRSCTLSKMDRFMAGSSRQHLRLMSDEYLIENYCQEPKSKSKCQFKKLSGMILKTVDAFYNNTVEDEMGCRDLCLKTTDFPCRTYHFMSAEKDTYCRLSHHSKSSLSHIQEPYINIEDNNSFELSSCYQVNVECRGDGMSVTIHTGKLFDGTVYARSRPNTCAVDGQGDYFVSLDLPYNDIKCDVLQENEGFYLANIVVQHHDMIVTADDIGFSLHCKYFLENQTVTNELPFIELKDGIQTEYVKETIVRSPNVTMTIATPEGAEIISAQVGDKLALIFEIVTPNSPYEIFVRELVAIGIQEKDKIVLIDERGCPAQPTIMKAVTRVEGGKTLQTLFYAFKFQTGDEVHFRALVTPCLPTCEPVICDGDTIDGIGYTSHGRKKRSINEEPALLLARSVKITDKFTFEDTRTEQIVEREETTLYKACVSTYALMIAVVIFIIAEVVLLVVWRNLWHKRQGNKHIEPISGAIPPEIVYGSLSSRNSTRYLTS